MKLSRREQLIIEIMKSSPRSWTLEDLAAHLYQGEERPPEWRSSVKATMRTLALKTLYARERVVRISDLGRGRTAKYELRSGRRGHSYTPLVA